MSTTRSLSTLIAALALTFALIAAIPAPAGARTVAGGAPVSTAALPASYRLFLDEVGGSHFVAVRGSSLHYGGPPK